MKSIELLPAVDIRSGQAARLQQGSLTSLTTYGAPGEIIDNFIESGASWIHLVDLDAAFGSGNNRALINDLINTKSVKFALSGGVFNQESLDFAISTKAQRINLATSALLDLQWVEKVIDQHKDLLSVSLDVQGSNLIARGTGQAAGDLLEMIGRLDQMGCTRFVITDIETDGALTGPNFELLSKVISVTKAKVVASGGVASAADLTKLRALNLDGVILGKALYTGQIDLQEAISACYK
jgi:1-(5-phosphoribosyl)-5-[(5-phosphoribosylamino)methylideneamino] imidazole-4-carboxamide isomerase/N-(5'phosphoribosyl)anthranilate isomerase